jgi:hypothetical protein
MVDPPFKDYEEPFIRARALAKSLGKRTFPTPAV